MSKYGDQRNQKPAEWQVGQLTTRNLNTYRALCSKKSVPIHPDGHCDTLQKYCDYDP